MDENSRGDDDVCGGCCLEARCWEKDLDAGAGRAGLSVTEGSWPLDVLGCRDPWMAWELKKPESMRLL